MERLLSKLRSPLKAKWAKLPSLAQRAITAVVLAPLFFVALYIGGLPFTALIILMAILSYREWLPLVQTKWPKVLEYAAYAFLALALFVGAFTSFKLGFILLVIGFLVVAALAHLYIDKGDRRAPPWLSFGLFYIGVPLLAVLWLRAHGGELSPDRAWAPVALLFFQVWATDTGAYFAGRAIGGPKIAPKISPTKTWAGLVGGAACSAIVMGGLATFWAFKASDGFFLAGIILAVIAQAGDFFESYVKRRAGVKDSGTIIPGHGGILDRIDGVLTAAVAYFLFILLLV